MKIGKIKIISVVGIIAMFTTFAGFEFYAETQNNYELTSLREENAKVLEETVEDSESVETTESEPETVTGQEEKIAVASLEQKTPSLVNTLIIADVTDYVNIRSEANEESEILGKLYDKSVGTYIEEKGEWIQIESGSVKGYVRAEYVLTGEEAKIRADEAGARLAEVTTTTLKVREEATTDSDVLGLIPCGDTLSVKEEVDGWIKVSIEEGEGYVSTDYLNVYTENVKAESVEEEQIRLEKEEAERIKAEEAAKKALQEKEAAKKAAAKTPTIQSLNTTSKKQASGASSSSSSNQQASTGNASLGQQIASYGLQFVGNPYVYGGTSLTDGTDCSGFVKSVYSHFGISMPRTSGEQGSTGRSVGSIGNAQPGDIVWYSGHIAIYIGNGNVVHASNEKEGIKVSNASYRTILGVRRIV